MAKPIARSVGILDGMILMVGVAIGALFTRLYLVNNYEGFFGRLADVPSTKDYVRWVMGEASEFACLWLMALTPVAFFIRLRGPRPALGRLLLQPGTTALFAAMVVMSSASILAAGAVAAEGAGPWFFFYQNYLIRLFPYAGAAVAAAWSLQVLGRRWKPEAGAIDRLGRLLGACWVATFLFGTLAALQQGALSSRQASQVMATFESADSAIIAEQDDRLTRRRKFLEQVIELNDKQIARLTSLVEGGDREALKAEVATSLESARESRRESLQEIDQIEKEAANPTANSADPAGPIPATSPTPVPPSPN